MKKSMLVILLFTFTLFARKEAFPIKQCSAFNNMKHSKNTHNIVLNTERSYTVLKHHKGQNLILIRGEKPAQRWVDESFFSGTKKEYKPQKHSIERELPLAPKNTAKSKILIKIKIIIVKNMITPTEVIKTFLHSAGIMPFVKHTAIKKSVKEALLH